MAAKKTGNSKSNHEEDKQSPYVSLSREEYNAFQELEVRYAEATARSAKATNLSHDLSLTCDAQARRLVESDSITRHHERVNGLQRVYIDLLRADHPHVAALEDLSEFWRQWLVSVGDPNRAPRPQRETVAKFEPDLFRSWQLWVDKLGRSFSVAGSRTEVDDRRPVTQVELQVDAMQLLQDTTDRLSDQVRKLESEIESYKKGASKQGS
jgi:hypothetical protein